MDATSDACVCYYRGHCTGQVFIQTLHPQRVHGDDILSLQWRTYCCHDKGLRDQVFSTYIIYSLLHCIRSVYIILTVTLCFTLFALCFFFFLNTNNIVLHSATSGDGICCKVDELFNYLLKRKEIYHNIKYAIVGDDDYYFRVDRVMEWLSYIDHANISHIPLLSNGFTAYDYMRDRFAKV